VGPYVSGHVGVSGGDSGPAVAAGGSVGYVTPRRLGFELEITVTPGLDLGSLGRREDPPFAQLTPFPFPQPTFEATGRLLTFQTNVTGALNSSSRLRVFVVGGGGMANLHQDIIYRIPGFVFPPFPPTLGGLNEPVVVFTPLEFDFREERITRSENALCLNAGGIVEFALTARFGLGVDARYMHAFFAREGMDMARVVARARWQF
jgi:hypothetical protein